MPVDYGAIRAENKQEYGNIARWGGGVFEGQYADRTHFIYEIIQNADDALASRSDKPVSRTLTFSLKEDALSITHFGRLFNEYDVRGICGIDLSTKEFTDIGRFGLGFKSVYKYTDRPEVHSGDEHFAIETYVHPIAVDARTTSPSQTLIYLPFKDDVRSAVTEIGAALKELDPLTLLFLRHIDEITWEMPDGSSGWMRRSDSTVSGLDIRTIWKGSGDSSDIVAQFVVSGRDVFHEGHRAGRVEIAFRQNRDTQGDENAAIHRAQVSKLAAFFPTEIDTHLGFLVQGPYRTTPARDNVPFGDEWNQYLVRETANLAVEALEQLRDAGLLDLDALECFLPTPETENDKRFAPIRQAIREALINQALIPTDRGHVAGRHAFIANPPAVKALLGMKRLRQLVGGDQKTHWLVDEITSESRRHLWQYLTSEVNVRIVTTEFFLRALDQDFLYRQPDSWIHKLYGFLNERHGLMYLAKQAPLIRLEDGGHVPPFDGDGKPLAYLPGKSLTSYPTVKPGVCTSRNAHAFLEAMGLREPDVVDDIVDHVLPKYRKPLSRLTQASYQADILRIADAYATGTKEQQERLISEASSLRLIYAMDCGTKEPKERHFVSARETYLASEPLKALFDNVPGVLIVDHTKRALRNERVVQLFRALGASHTLVRETCEPSLSQHDKRQLRLEDWRRDAGITREIHLDDFTLRGVTGVLSLISGSLGDQSSGRSTRLWNALRAYAQREGEQGFKGTYVWYYYTRREQPFPAAFVKELNEAVWIPDNEGNLHVPREVPFSATGWPDNELLREFINFAPEPETRHDLQGENVEEIRLRQELIESGLSEEDIDARLQQAKLETLRQLRRNRQTDPAEHTPTIEGGSSSTQSEQWTGGHGSDGMGDPQRPPTIVQIPPRPPSPGGATPKDVVTKTTSPAPSEPPVRVELDDDDDNPEGLSHEERDALEEAGIAKILEQEPTLKRTPENNPGYDLYTLDENENPIKVVEVKSMSGSLNDRPATMTRTQFHAALDQAEKYWLYVVEYAGDPERSRIRKIQNPANRVRRFSFGRGWFEDS